MLGPACLLAPLAALAAATSTTAPGGTLVARLRLEPALIDYEVPGHPRLPGRGHLGAIARLTARYAPNPSVEVEAGVLARLPFALDFEDEVGALPVLSLTVHPYTRDLSLRFGSLDTRHGYHPALLDEAAYAYGRPVRETYNRSLDPSARKDFGRDPFMPGEHGVQLVGLLENARVEAFLDWQLLETEVHREKFAFGLLGTLWSRWADVSLQYRLIHYGGELFTKSDPARAAGLDHVRQPSSFAIAGRLRPLLDRRVTIELPAAVVAGRLAQVEGGPEEWHAGLEVGVEVLLFERLRLGYRAWIPKDDRSGFISEDGDPVYSEARAHRASIALSDTFGGVTVDGRLDLVKAEDAPRVQYLAVTRLGFALDWIVF